jgi:hypothetical protein
VSEAYRVLVKHLDEASSPSNHAHYSHPFFKFHRGSESSFFDEDEYDEYDEYDDEYYESDEEVASFLSVISFPLRNNMLTSFLHILRYVFLELMKNRYSYVNRNPRQ